MNLIRIKTILPLSDQILLVSFDDLTANLRDVKFLVNRFPELRPHTARDRFIKTILENPRYIEAWATELDRAEPEPEEGAPAVTLSLPADRHKRLLWMCSSLEVSLEQLVRALVRLLTFQEGQTVFRKWLID